MQVVPNRDRLVPAIRYLAAGALVLLAFVAPLEEIDPPELFNFRISSVEGALLLALLLGLLSIVVSWEFKICPRLTVPASIVLIALLAASLAAVDSAVSLRHSGRFFAGIILFLVFINVVKDHQVTTVVLAAAISGLGVAVLAILEPLGISLISDVLAYFKSSSYRIGGVIRASSTLQYPTIASMYLELTFCLWLGLLLQSRNGRRVMSLCCFLSLLVLTQAVVSTLTRAGLLVIIVTLILTSLYWWHRAGTGRVFNRLLLLGSCVLIQLIVNLTLNADFRLRLRAPDEKEWYKAEFQVPGPIKLEVGQVVNLPIKLRNIGEARWNSTGIRSSRISYFWLLDGDEAVLMGGIRTELPWDIDPDQSVDINVRVRAPDRPGRYRLALDVLREGEFWFSTRGSEVGLVPAEVHGEPIAGYRRQPQPPPEDLFQVSRPQLWLAAARILKDHPLLGIGPGNFKTVYGRYLGLERWDHKVHTNNMYVEFFVAAGVLGGVLFLLLCWCLVDLVRSSLQRGSDELLPLRLGASAAVLAFLLHGLADYFLEFTPIYVLIWMILGMLVVLKGGASLQDDHRF